MLSYLPSKPVNMTSSLKPEVHDISQRCQRRIDVGAAVAVTSAQHWRHSDNSSSCRAALAPGFLFAISAMPDIYFHDVVNYDELNKHGYI